MGTTDQRDIMMRVVMGISAGLVTIAFFTMDQLDAFKALHRGDSAFNYSMIIIMFYILFVMNFIAGYKHEYEVSLVYTGFMVVYDLATNGLVTIVFAVISFVSLIIGMVASRIRNMLKE